MTQTIETAFVIDDTTYNESNGRYYKTEDGKKTRIGKAAYDAAAAEWVEMVTDRAKQDAEQDEVDAVLDELNHGQDTVATVTKTAPAKKRKPKDVAHEAEGVTLTAKQVDFIRHLPDTCFWEQGLDSCIWVDCLCDEIGGQFAGKPMTVGAMISTLCEKGLGRRMNAKVNGRTSTSFELTVKGKLIAGKLIPVRQ